MLDKTARAADNIIHNYTGKEKTIYGIKTKKYIRPEEISTRINEKLRNVKDDEVKLWYTLLEKEKHAMPGASEEKLKASVYKKIQEIKHGKKEEHDPELTFKPDISNSVFSKPPAPVKPRKRGYKYGTSIMGTSAAGTSSKINKSGQNKSNS